MQLPSNDSSAQTHYLAGRYTLRAGAREGVEDVTGAVKGINDEVLRLGRDVEDLEAPTEDAICDRDQVDNDLDDTVRLLRNQLLSEGVHREREEPYASIFPDGLREYTEATLDEKLVKYGLLIARLEANLAANHQVRVSFVPKLQVQLAAWSAAVAAVNAARQAQDAGKRRLELGIANWERTMNEVYASLVARVGSRRRADRFFKRAKGKPRRAAAPPAAEQTSLTVPRPQAGTVFSS